MFDFFKIKLVEIIDSNAPYIALFKKWSKLRHKPWITSGILKSILKKFTKTKKINSIDINITETF